MSTSQRTFDQVKNILGKLDRNIDAARARRMQPRPMTPAPSAPLIQPASMTVAAGQPSLNTVIPATPTTASPSMIGQSNGAAPTPTSPYGRAQPRARPMPPNP